MRGSGRAAAGDARGGPTTRRRRRRRCAARVTPRAWCTTRPAGARLDRASPRSRSTTMPPRRSTSRAQRLGDAREVDDARVRRVQAPRCRAACGSSSRRSPRRSSRRQPHAVCGSRGARAPPAAAAPPPARDDQLAAAPVGTPQLVAQLVHAAARPRRTAGPSATRGCRRSRSGSRRCCGRSAGARSRSSRSSTDDRRARAAAAAARGRWRGRGSRRRRRRRRTSPAGGRRASGGSAGGTRGHHAPIAVSRTLRGPRAGAGEDCVDCRCYRRQRRESPSFADIALATPPDEKRAPCGKRRCTPVGAAVLHWRPAR